MFASIDLNALLPSNSGWALSSANAINNAGQITGSGIFNVGTHVICLNC